MPQRRDDLAAFLRSRRSRITPEDAGLPPGIRRRTPGLRREEVAQLAGVGVTWYTWLEQGRPINASSQVLDSISRTLKLDQAERQHLFHLADVPAEPRPEALEDKVPAELQTILNGLSPFAASVLNSRFDLLAWNEPYAALFPGLVATDLVARNVLWQCFVVHEGNPPFANHEIEHRLMVASLRAAYGRHLNEPAWNAFIRKLSAASASFAQLWAGQEVGEVPTRIKRFICDDVDGEIRLMATSFAVNQLPECRMVVYTPIDAEAADKMSALIWHRQILS